MLSLLTPDVCAWACCLWTCSPASTSYPHSASPHSGSWVDSQKWLTKNALAARTPNDRHVKMNHAMQHMAPTVLFAGLLLLAQSDARCWWPAMALDDELRHAGFLRLQFRACRLDWGATLSLWNFTTMTVCAFYGTMQLDGPISQKWTELFPQLKMFLSTSMPHFERNIKVQG